MTFEVYFNTEEALLLYVKYSLKNLFKNNNDIDYLSVGSTCVLSLVAALEALVNKLIQERNRILHWDELKLLSKIEEIAQQEKIKIEWGNYPWQKISRLIRIRNWIAHNKESYIGLSGYKDVWVNNGVNKPPKIDPEIELKKESIQKYYDAVRECGMILCKIVGVEDNFEFLKTEKYEPIIS
jgi:hypothetical protein